MMVSETCVTSEEMKYYVAAAQGEEKASRFDTEWQFEEEGKQQQGQCSDSSVDFYSY